MRYIYILLLVGLLSIHFSFSQNIKGKITDKSGEPLYGSLAYIKELNHGLVCNMEGEYQATLVSGVYHVEYKCLGFVSVEREVHITAGQIVEVSIALEENPFMLQEVVVSSGEDPAYPIMRKAIEKAPFYANAVESYLSETYIKVSAELLKIPSFVEKIAKKQEGVQLSELTDKVFLQESFSEIEFSSPDKYKQTVKGFSSSIPDNMNAKDVSGIIQSSLYTPKMGRKISPLNPQAFTYYKFRYEGFFEEENRVVNKIRIIPKKQDPTLVSGYLYIADNSWHIHSAELLNDDLGVKEDYRIMYELINDKVYLPITYHIITTLDVMGIEAIFNNYASISYTDVVVNTNFPQEQKTKPKKRSFEIKIDDEYTKVADTMAVRKDSTYWSSIRTLPLDKREIASFVEKDSIQQYLDSVRNKHHNPKFSLMNIVTGGKTGSDSSKVRFEYGGLIKSVTEYNFVDGFWLGQKFSIGVELKKHKKLEVKPSIYYATGRKKWMTNLSTSYTYAPRRLGKLELTAKSSSEDFNPDGFHRLYNAFTSLAFGRNYNFFYQKNSVGVTNIIEVSNGLQFLTGFEIAKRQGLSNTSDYTWGRRRTIKPNIHSDERFDRTAYQLGINYAPYTYYKVRDGLKEYVNVTSPVFYLRYNHGFSSWQVNNSKYKKITFGMQQSLKLNEFSAFDYIAEGGSFLGSTSQMHFADYQHINTSELMGGGLRTYFTPMNVFRNYEVSTNRYWARGGITYSNKYILIKRLPFMQGLPIIESLHLNTIYTPEFRTGSEFGYSISVAKWFNIGVFTTFKNIDFQNVGFGCMFNVEGLNKILW